MMLCATNRSLSPHAPRALLRAWTLAAVLQAALFARPADATTHDFPPGDSLPSEIRTSLAPGDTLLVSPGARRVHETLPSGITIRGQSTLDAVIFTPGRPESPIFVILPGADTTRVENVTFDCTSDQLATGLYFRSAVMSVRGNRFTGGYAIKADSSSGIIVENSFDVVKSAVRCDQSTIWIDRNDIVGATDAAISMRGSPLRITRNRIVQNVNTGIVVTGKRFAPVIGGEPGMGNEIHGGFNSDVFTTGGKPINAQYNYWGIKSTEEMNLLGYPANITAVCDGWDQDKAAGMVDYRNWLDRPGGQPVKMKKRGAAGLGAGRTTVAIVALVVLVAVGAVLGARRRKPSESA